MKRPVTFRLANTNGKEWRIEGEFSDGRSFVMQPVGNIFLGEARDICRGIMNMMRAGMQADAMGLRSGGLEVDIANDG